MLPSSLENYYNQGNQKLIKLSVADRTRRFPGAGIYDGVVVRIDLNGYSDWAQGQAIANRARLLNAFFTKVITSLNMYDGLYFRDEGDCVVALFSENLGSADPYRSAYYFCMQVIEDSVTNNDPLKAKAIVSTGEMAFYQKLHEIEVSDWSAEGEPFVKAVRMEQAVDSKPQIYFFQDEFNRHFNQYVQRSFFPQPNQSYWKICHGEKERIQGLRKAGGWATLTTMIYVPRVGV